MYMNEKWSLMNIFCSILNKLYLLILTPRHETQANILDEVKRAITLMQKFPDHFAGFDVAGQEDALLYPSQLSPLVDLPYFFHAGETGRYTVYVNVYYKKGHIRLDTFQRKPYGYRKNAVGIKQ